MKAISYLLALVGFILSVYAVIGRFVHGPTVGGYLFPLEAKTLISGANTVLLFAILAALYSKK